MNRVDLINFLLTKTKGENYLEIGVRNGKTIVDIKAKRKVGVDPAYKLKKDIYWKRLFGIEQFKLYKTTSDQFFIENGNNVFPKGIDVVFVDGLHNFSQSLKDVQNALQYLNEDGYIVLHDCNPKGPAQAFPVERSYDEVVEKLNNGGIPGWTGEWNGDVWKTIVYLKATNPQLDIKTIDTDQGLGVIKKGQGKLLSGIKGDEIKHKDFEFLNKNREELLNLISVKQFFKGFKS